MNKNKSFLSDKIVLQVIFYVIFVVGSIMSVFIIDNYMHKRLSFLNGLLSNETSRIHLNDILKSKMSDVQNTLLNYTNARSFDEMEKYEKQIANSIESMESILFILEHGGVYVEDMNVNYEGLENVKYKVEYEKNYVGRFNIHVLDIQAKVVDIKELLDKFRSLVIDIILSRQSGSVEAFREVDERKNIMTKSMEAFFVRMDESSNRLYLEAEKSENELKSYIESSMVKFSSQKLRLNLALGIIFLVSGVLMCMNILRIVKSRLTVSEELNKLNSSLEETVKKRTGELETQVRIREEQERESFERAQFLTDVIESLAHPFYVIDAETYEIILANKAAYRSIGSTGRTCYELTHHANHPCDGLDHPCPLQTVLKTGAATSVEHIHFDQSGEKRYVEVHGYPVRNSEGKVIQMIEYSLDITEKKDAERTLINLNSILEQKVAERTEKLEAEVKNRKNAEEKLIANEKYFRQLIANISDIIIIADETLRITYVSPSIEQICGFPPEYLLGKPLEYLVQESDGVIFDHWIENVLRRHGEQRVAELRILKRSGAYLNAEVLAKNMLENNVINGVVVNIRDVTVRKKAEEELKKLALVMEQNPNSIVITDIDGNIEFVNPAFEKITGYSLEEALGKNPNVLKTDHTEPAVFEELWKTVTKGEVWNGEFVNKKKNGELYIEHAIIAPIMNDRGEIVNYLGMKENITELKQARAKAEESNRAKSMFLANMSHEIRTPLNGLMGFLELLKHTPLDSEQAEYLSTIKFSADTLLKILNDILDLSKIESGMMDIESSEMNLGFQILSTVKAFYAKASAKGVRLYSYIDPQVPSSLLGDALRISQVVSNLLNNAVKFTHAGGVIKVNVELKNETKKTATVLIAVEDTGVGIPDGKIKSVFEPFAQVDSSVTRKYGGTGLGLTISRNLLKLMKSDIELKSEKGKGSKFYFELVLKKTISVNSDKKNIGNGRVYIYEGGSAELYTLFRKYLESLNGSYKLIDAIDPDEDYTGSVFIFNGDSYEADIVSELLDKGVRVVCVMEASEKTYAESLDDRVVTLFRPFGGALFYEALTGHSFDEEEDVMQSIKNMQSFDGCVLLAEDNSVNIRLMEALLRRLGVDADVAENGQIAVDLCETKKYDLILMDINMPVMDGIEAVRTIREHENALYRSRTPIYALTAHSLTDLGGRINKSDFEGYLSKPINLEALEKILKKHLKKSEIISYSGEAFNMSEIVDELGLPDDMLYELLNGYSVSLTGDIANMKSLAENEEYNMLKSLIHSNRGAADNLRLKTLAVLFEEIEKSINVKDKDGIINNIDQLDTELVNVRLILDQQRGGD